MGPTTEERETILRTYFAGCTLMTAGFTLQLYLCIQGIYSFYRMPRSARRGRKLYIYVMVLTLLASFIVYVADALGKGGLLITGATIDYDRPAPVWLNLMYFLGIGVIHASGDGLLAWRCYLLWRAENRLLGLIPLIPYVSSIATGITQLAAAIRINPSLPETRAFYERVQSAALFLSLGVSICATTLIVIRLRRTGREMRALESRLQEDDRDNPYTKIAIILIESALPFTLFGIASAIASTLFAVNQDLEMVTTSTIAIMLPLWVNSCALAPQLIIFRIATGASWISSPLRTRSRSRTLTQSEPVFTTQLSQFMGPVGFSQPAEDSKDRLSAVETFGAVHGTDQLDVSNRGSENI